MVYIALYLTAIIAANLLVARFGPSVAVLNAFLFIGLDLTARDHLHEAWKERGLVWKMVLLIGAGSVLSWVLNRDAGQIALASFVSFACAGVADAVVYHLLLRHREKLGDKVGWNRFDILVYRTDRHGRLNGSNLVSAGVDSFVFPALAFGFPLMWGIMLGQFAAKVGGGFAWSLVLRRLEK